MYIDYVLYYLALLHLLVQRELKKRYDGEVEPVHMDSKSSGDVDEKPENVGSC